MTPEINSRALKRLASFRCFRRSMCNIVFMGLLKKWYCSNSRGGGMFGHISVGLAKCLYWFSCSTFISVHVIRAYIHVRNRLSEKEAGEGGGKNWGNRNIPPGAVKNRIGIGIDDRLRERAPNNNSGATLSTHYEKLPCILAPENRSRLHRWQHVLLRIKNVSHMPFISILFYNFARYECGVGHVSRTMSCTRTLAYTR